MLIFAIALLCVGGLVALLSGVWTLALAFQRHVLWGLTVLLVPFGGNVAFLFVGWREARAPFLLGLGSLACIGAAFYSMPKETIRKPWKATVAAYQTDQQTQKRIADQGMIAA